MPHFRNLRSTAFNLDYYQEHQAEGLDYLHFGDWQRKYGRWLVDVFGLRGQPLLDVGCACGSLTAGLAASGVAAHGVDVSEAMIEMGRKRVWSDECRVSNDADAAHSLSLHVCDVVNLHLFGEGTFAFIHSHQSAEHWQPRLVPHALVELHRVARPGARFFCVLDTAELGQRQGRDLAKEDPTHVCIRPLDWWHQHLAAAGWIDCTEDYRHPLLEHGWSYLPDHDWDWWAVRKG
ncbi:MAG: class I SAM-dependent methyltransferase [Pirellulales bacterium]